MRQTYAFAVLVAGAFGATMIGSQPAAAQVQDRVVIVYGNDKCPSSGGQEIVVCRRAPETERYRIPKDLRESEPDPHALGGQAVAAMASTGGTGVQVQSCNAIGAGVSAGCLTQQTAAWKAQKTADAKQGADIP